MPVLRSSDCSAVAPPPLGKSLSFPCPSERRTWDTPTLDVDRHLTRVNGHGIDVRHSGLARRERAAETCEKRMARLSSHED